MDDILKIQGDIDGLWLHLNVLKIVVANLITREAMKSEDAEGALRRIADDLSASWDDRNEPEGQRNRIEAARMVIDDILALARSALPR